MAAKTVVAGSDVSASQLKDLMRQIEDGSLGAHEMQALLEHRNPFTFERNKHGHVVITFVGLDLAGHQEIDQLKNSNFTIGDMARFCLLSKNTDGYDKKHRLIVGKEYKVALMPGKEIIDKAQRTKQNLLNRGIEHYGYGKPIAGLSPRIREVLTDKQMEELGIWYVVSLHDPIKKSLGDLCLLGADRDGEGRRLSSYYGRPSYLWNEDGLFAFPVSSST